VCAASVVAFQNLMPRGSDKISAKDTKCDLDVHIYALLLASPPFPNLSRSMKINLLLSFYFLMEYKYK